MRLAFVVALANCVYGIFAQNSPGHWFLNVTVGGIFDEIPQCSVSLFHFKVTFPCSTIFSCPNLLHKVLVGIRDDSDFSSSVLLALHIHSLGIRAKDETEKTSFSRHSKADT